MAGFLLVKSFIVLLYVRQYFCNIFGNIKIIALKSYSKIVFHCVYHFKNYFYSFREIATHNVFLFIT